MKLARSSSWLLSALGLALLFAAGANASIGDRLPDFKNCIKICEKENCGSNPTPIALYKRILLWNCESECDYTCQHLVTNSRLARDPPYLHPVQQFHGKWPFYRFLGVQEPFSVLFSLLNFLAHDSGISSLRASIPSTYPLRPYYLAFGYLGLGCWIASMIFHARDFALTERLDYFAAGANILYGTYYAPIRVFRLDQTSGPYSRRHNALVLRAWTALCIALYVAHVAYLSLWTWDYTYNMVANIVVASVSNLLWCGFSYVRYKRYGHLWMAWPAMIVGCITLAMSLEVLDFPPWAGAIDAHALWHLGTVVPTVWWYRFLVRDAQNDLAETRLKA